MGRVPVLSYAPGESRQGSVRSVNGQADPAIFDEAGGLTIGSTP